MIDKIINLFKYVIFKFFYVAFDFRESMAYSNNNKVFSIHYIYMKLNCKWRGSSLLGFDLYYNKSWSINILFITLEYFSSDNTLTLRAPWD